jgi:hypothetical protein
MERGTEHSQRLLAVARTLRYLAEDPFAFETILRQLAAEYESAARQRPARPLTIDLAVRGVLERLVGAAPAAARPLRGAAARHTVALRRAKGRTR